MATTNADLVYRVIPFGPNAAVETALGGVPLPQPILSVFGLLLKTDVTSVSGGAVIRTINLGLVPTTTATVTAQLRPGANVSGSPVATLTLTGAGSGYAAPPYLTFTNAAGDTTGKGAKGRALLDVGGITVTAPGSGYVTPIVTLVGGLSAKGVAATATATVGGGGAITGITVITPGSGYTGVPTVVVTDVGGGTGAVAVAQLQVSSVALDAGGKGYQAAPTVNIVPAFKMYFPDGANQAAPLKNLFTSGLQRTSHLQVLADAPIIT